MTVRDLRLEVYDDNDDLRVDVAVIGISSELTDEIIGKVRLNVHQGYLQIQVEREVESWTGPVEVMVA